MGVSHYMLDMVSDSITNPIPIPPRDDRSKIYEDIFVVAPTTAEPGHPIWSGKIRKRRL